MKRNLLIIFAFLLTSSFALAQTSLAGKVTEEDSGEPVLFGNVALYKGGVLITGVETDFDGNYSITNIDPGTYDVEATYVGFNPQRITDVIVAADKVTKVDIQLGVGGVTLEEVIVKGYKVPLIEQDNTTQGGIVTADQIKTLPTKNINGLAAQTAGVGSADDGDDLSIRGSRSGSTDYYVDGIRVRSANMVPQSEIDQMQVITGGVAAQYGDVTGGVISVTTKGPSSKVTGGFEVETSEFLDSYGYNLLSGNISGPILKRKDGTSILGYRFSGQYLNRQDDDPPALPIYQVTDEKLAELEANPVAQLGQTFTPAAEFVTDEDINVLDYRPNEENVNLNLTGKIDARLSDAIDISISGGYIDESNRFTPGNVDDNNLWRVFNSHNNPTDENERYRGNFRFRHRLGGARATADGEEKTTSVIQNASYTLQFGYERNLNNLEDPRHNDNYFAYGHIGNFNYDWTPFAAESLWSGATPTIIGVGFAHVDYRREFLGADFTNSSNPVLAAYNNNVPNDVEDDLSYSAINGQFLGNVTNVWNTHQNVGQVYNFNRKQDNDYYTFNANSSFEIVPNGDSEKGRHSIQFGILYEQRFIREHSLSPRNLWVIARGQANRHLSGVDTTALTGATFVQEVFGDSLTFQEFHPVNTEDEFEGNYFFRRVREIDAANPVPINEYFNVDALDPDQLSLEMFSAQELNDNANLGLNYFGYDYLGNKLANDVSFDDFFSVTDENNVRTYPVTAFQPIYSAAYIQDKFTYKDIIFRLGLRVDRYDANTKVLKDNYSLYEVMRADDFYAMDDVEGERPATIGDDFRVYVDGDSESSNSVKAYRNGDQWYFEDGSEANNGALIFGTGVVNPRYYSERENNIRSRDFDPSNSFEDYTPQLNWMPRLAFSFPISDEANFYANYDILVQRPGTNEARGTALDYLYFEERSSSELYRNPNLRPQRTITYEVGFKQKLSNTSALNVSMYYRELRDMIQRRTFQFVASPVNNYLTYDNQDFGTVKAFSFQYDMRRTNNLQLNASYTLQFADGTGSDADSQRNTGARGNLRNLFPLNFDERHRFNIIADYRYDSGKRYNGPEIAGKQIFANAGINLQATAVSGRPYTASIRPEVYDGAGTRGSLNGARKPWNYWINMRVDKNFSLTKPGAGRGLNLNVYFRVQNLLDARNVIDVYTATGSPEDDGYLTSSNGLDAIQQIVNAENRSLDAFFDAYNWGLVNPGFYSIPRRMYVGAIIDF